MAVFSRGDHHHCHHTFNYGFKTTIPHPTSQSSYVFKVRLNQRFQSSLHFKVSARMADIWKDISLNLKLPKLRPDSCDIFTEECNLIFEPLLSRRSQVANIFPMDGWVQKSYGTIESCFQGIFGFGLSLVDGGCIPEGIESGGAVREQQASVPGLNASTSKLYSTDCSAAAKVLWQIVLSALLLWLISTLRSINGRFHIWEKF